MAAAATDGRLIMDQYSAAKEAYVHREGHVLAGVTHWRRIALILGLIAVISTAGLVAIASQSRLVPYVVEVDHKGAIQNVAKANQIGELKPSIYRSVFSGWIENLRQVTPDVQLQRRLFTKAFAFLSANSQAHTRVSEWFKENNPLDRAKTETVNIKVERVLQLTPNTWEVQWTETVRERKQGTVLSVSVWDGRITFVRGQVTEQGLVLNPFGLYVDNFDFQERSSS